MKTADEIVDYLKSCQEHYNSCALKSVGLPEFHIYHFSATEIEKILVWVGAYDE